MINKLILDYRSLVDENLALYLKKRNPEKIYEAMNYSVFAGGKRIRPLLMLIACESFGGNINDCMPFACAMELIHTYSLIHDDLPSMDNDDLRRGKPTSHKVFGEAMAILAGDALLNKAFEIMSCACVNNFSHNNILAQNKISLASGSLGMIGGQVLDIESENTEISDEQLRIIHEKKTAALIKASIVCGGIIAGLDDKSIEFLNEIGLNIGLAFQIRDDILDVTSSQEKLGKPIFSDQKNNKQTYVSLHGLEKANFDYNVISNLALEKIKIKFWRK